MVLRTSPRPAAADFAAIPPPPFDMAPILGVDRLGWFEYRQVGADVYRRPPYGSFLWECPLWLWNDGSGDRHLDCYGYQP